MTYNNNLVLNIFASTAVICRLDSPLNRLVTEGINETTNITSSCMGKFQRCFDIGMSCQSSISSTIAAGM